MRKLKPQLQGGDSGIKVSNIYIKSFLVSPLTRDGQPRRRAGRFAGAALQDARRSKERTYPDLLNNQRCRLVVLAIEVGGRWSEEAAAFINNLVRARASQQSVAAALRWSATLTAAMTPFAATLLGEATPNLYNVDTNPVNWSQLLAEAPPDPPSSSRPPPCLSIPGPWTFALRASRVPGDCPVKQSEQPQTDAEKGAEEKKKKKIISISNVCQSVAMPKLDPTMKQFGLPFSHAMFQSCIEENRADDITLLYPAFHGELFTPMH